MTAPLTGIRVLDLGRTFAAPFCTQLLADLGAEVVKVERPGRGDEMRHYGPPFIQDEMGADLPLSSFFLATNKNKRSISIDISKSEGQQLVRDLALTADVLVENFKVGDLARYGLDYTAIRAIRPDIVYCSITGFGQTGPYAERPATDGVFQAMSGLMSVTGEPGRPPQRVGLVATDLVTGLYAANAIQAAIRARDVLGAGGQHIDMSLLDSAVAMMSHRALEYLMTGDVPQALGVATPGSAPAQIFPCSDGYINIQASAEPDYRRFCSVISRPDLAHDPRFQTRRDRFEHLDRLEPEIAKAVASWRVCDLYEALVAAQVICSPVYSVDQMFADPQVRHRALQQEWTSRTGLKLPTLRNPIRFSATPIEDRYPPPEIGEHSDELLREILCLDDDQIATLRANDII